jgi:hypothetical protein
MSIIGIIRYTENSGLQVHHCIDFGKQCLNPAMNKIDDLCFFLYCIRTNHQKILGILHMTTMVKIYKLVVAHELRGSHFMNSETHNSLPHIFIWRKNIEEALTAQSS